MNVAHVLRAFPCGLGYLFGRPAKLAAKHLPASGGPGQVDTLRGLQSVNAHETRNCRAVLALAARNRVAVVRCVDMYRVIDMVPPPQKKKKRLSSIVEPRHQSRVMGP